MVWVKKKGIMEVQFSWIFILVVGAIILLFFASIVTKQKQSSDIKFSGTLVKRMRSILTGVEVSSGTSHKIDIPNARIELTCDTYSIGRTGGSYKNKIVFSPSLIRGDEMVTWTLPWSAPFKIANLLLLTGLNTKYVFIDGIGDFDQEFYDSFPANITKEIANTPFNVPLENYDKVKFVFVNATDSEVLSSNLFFLQSMKDSDVRAVNIKSDGHLGFFVKNGANFQFEGESFYIGDALKPAAVFAEDLEMYECSLSKAMKRFNFVTKLYMNRTQMLANANISECPAAYYSTNQLEQIEAYTRSFDISDLESLNDAIDSLEYRNSLLEQKSCPYIY